MKRAVIVAAVSYVVAVGLQAQQTPAPAPGAGQTPPAPREPQGSPEPGRGTTGSGQPPATGRQGVPPGGQVATGPGRGRPTPPQPQQKQGPEYLAGTWEFTWTGRESPVTTGPRVGSTAFTRQGDSQTLDIRTEGKAEDTGAAFKEGGSADWNEAQKTLTITEKLANGAELSGVGNWSSPLSIRYESKPTRVGNQTVRVRRTYSILSAQSFTVAEELSIDGGPFQRLGNGSFSKKE